MAVTPWESDDGWGVLESAASLFGPIGVFPESQLRVSSRAIADTDFVVVFTGEPEPQRESETFEELAALFAAYNDLWGPFPFSRYLVLFSPVVRNGLFVCTSRGSHADALTARRGTTDWRDLARRMHHSFSSLIFRPGAPDTVWYGESFNEYFPLRIRCELGLERGTFPQALHTHHYQNYRRYRQKAVGTRFDAPVAEASEFLRNHPDVHSALIHMKSPCIAFLMDRRIRELSTGERSLDDFVRHAFQEALQVWPAKRGLPETAGDIQRQLEGFTGASWQQFFDDYVRGTKYIDLEPYLPSE
jgi:hypothetical protein